MRCPLAAINCRPLSLSAARIELPGLLEEFVDDTGHFPDTGGGAGIQCEAAGSALQIEGLPA
jgi:hypothetical protein